MLRQVVESNLDVVHDRLPPALRPARRRLRRALVWTGRLGLPAAIVLVLGGSAPPPLTATDAAAGAASSPAASEPRPAALPEGSGVAFEMPGKPFPARVLALGVRRIVIDAGHGGENRGTASADGLEEKAVTLDIARRVARLMAAQGFETVLTRGEDETVSLQERAAAANGWRGDLFLSIHVNSLESPVARGIETYYLGPTDDPGGDALAARENQDSGYALSDLRALLDRIFADTRRDESRRLAVAVQQALMDAVRPIDAGVRDRGVKTAPFVVLVATEMPAVLAEVSCLSNAEDARRLGTPDYRQRIAEALVSGVTRYARTRG